MSAKSAFQYVVTRTDGTNQRLFDTSMKVSIESYDIVEDAGEGLDLSLIHILLLSMFDAEGGFVEQEINFYAADYSSPESYKEPSYL